MKRIAAAVIAMTGCLLPSAAAQIAPGATAPKLEYWSTKDDPATVPATSALGRPVAVMVYFFASDLDPKVCETMKAKKDVGPMGAIFLPVVYQLSPKGWLTSPVERRDLVQEFERKCGVDLVIAKPETGAAYGANPLSPLSVLIAPDGKVAASFRTISSRTEDHFATMHAALSALKLPAVDTTKAPASVGGSAPSSGQ